MRVPLLTLRRVQHVLSVVLAALVQIHDCQAADGNSNAANHVNVDSTPSAVDAPLADSSALFHRLCTDNICRNGQCYLTGSSPKCVCDTMFRGARCQVVNMDRLQFSIIGSMVIFQWPYPPRLKGYSFIYYVLNQPGSIIYKNRIHMKDMETSVLVGNFRDGQTQYRVCIEDEYIADRVLAKNDVEYLSNCLTVATKPDYHSLAAWCLAGMLCVTIVLIVYWQKEKIELLYFSKPNYYMQAKVKAGEM